MKIKQICQKFALAASIGLLFTAGSAFGQEKTEKPLPNLSLNKIDGRRWNLDDERGNVVLLNFWATWCAPCRTEIPSLISLSKKYKANGLKIVGISIDAENVRGINRFIDDFKIDYQIVLAVPDSLLARQKAVPMSLLIDEKGVLAKKYVGAVEETVLEKDIKSLIAKKAGNVRDAKSETKGTMKKRAN